MPDDKFKRFDELARKDKFWALRMCAEEREAAYTKSEADQDQRAKTNPIAKLLAEIPPPPALNDAEAEEMVRLLIRYEIWEIGEQRRDELLAWLDKFTVHRRLMEQS